MPQKIQIELENNRIDIFIPFYNRIKKAMLETAQKEYYHIIAEIAQCIYVYVNFGQYIGGYGINYNELSLRKDSRPDEFVILAQKEVNKYILGRKTILHPEPNKMNFSCDFTIYSIHNKLLAKVNIQNTVMWKEFIKNKEIKNYTETESNSKKENKKIKDDWDHAIKNNKTRSLQFTMLTIDEMDLKLNTNEILNNMDSDAELCRKIAWCNIFDKYLDTILRKEPDLERNTELVDMIYELMEKRMRDMDICQKDYQQKLKSEEFFNENDLKIANLSFR